MNATQTKKQGFTIIEVVLVLAIAALIFLMVFIALPALQRNQRDTARKNDASTVAAAVQSFVSNERKALTADPADVTKLQSYIENLDQYETSGISVNAAATGAVTVGEDEIAVYVVSKCDGTELKGGVARSAAVLIKLEGSGGSNYCIDV